MGMGQRSRTRSASKIIRQIGESVVCLIAINHGDSADTSVPFSAVAAQASTNPTTDTHVSLYAQVTYHKTAEEKYDEAGRILNAHVTVQGSAYDAPTLIACYGFITKDGTRFRKSDENWSEGREYFTIDGDAVAVGVTS